MLNTGVFIYIFIVQYCCLTSVCNIGYLIESKTEKLTAAGSYHPDNSLE